MTRLKSISILLIALTSTMISFGQNNKVVTDYLKVPGPIAIAKKSYNLSWSSHPNNIYYKQEYLPKGDNADRFQSMALIDVITGNSNLKEVVESKVAELKKMKETNPIVNYETFENPRIGEYMLDFLLTANAPDGKVTIAERNVYRYKSFTTKAGQPAILLFGVSTRSYGADVDKFFTSLKTIKNDLINEVRLYKLPEIKL